MYGSFNFFVVCLLRLSTHLSSPRLSQHLPCHFSRPFSYLHHTRISRERIYATRGTQTAPGSRIGKQLPTANGQRPKLAVNRRPHQIAQRVLTKCPHWC
ncbi:hypothetical protein GGR55DRAFT_520792 [Xylaria sp. FL0064]|nr:hypothetical protein GGR55DRAFT_520792 [Xylaria sp. FL0064]